MDHFQDITKHTKGKHFSYGDRRELQGLLSNKSVHYSRRQLAVYFDCSPNTIRNEIQRGAHPNTGRYSASRAQKAYEESHANSIRKSRRFLASKFVSWTIEKVLKDSWSLDACHGYAVENSLFPISEMVCVKTLYNYVDSMLLKLRNIDLPLKVRRRKAHHNVKKNLKHLGRSIDERPCSIDERAEFGHWEIDTVVGSKSKDDNVVLTLVERVTRKYIAIKIDGKTADAVTTGMTYLKQYYGEKFSQIFKSITSDNGSGKNNKLSAIELYNKAIKMPYRMSYDDLVGELGEPTNVMAESKNNKTGAVNSGTYLWGVEGMDHGWIEVSIGRPHNFSKVGYWTMNVSKDLAEKVSKDNGWIHDKVFNQRTTDILQRSLYRNHLTYNQLKTLIGCDGVVLNKRFGFSKSEEPNTTYIWFDRKGNHFDTRADDK